MEDSGEDKSGSFEANENMEEEEEEYFEEGEEREGEEGEVEVKT